MCKRLVASLKLLQKKSLRVLANRWQQLASRYLHASFAVKYFKLVARKHFGSLPVPRRWGRWTDWWDDGSTGRCGGPTWGHWAMPQYWRPPPCWQCSWKSNVLQMEGKREEISHSLRRRRRRLLIRRDSFFIFLWRKEVIGNESWPRKKQAENSAVLGTKQERHKAGKGSYPVVGNGDEPQKISLKGEILGGWITNACMISRMQNYKAKVANKQRKEKRTKRRNNEWNLNYWSGCWKWHPRDEITRNCWGQEDVVGFKRINNLFLKLSRTHFQ